MPSAEIITIGTELLLGEIVDTNSQYLARSLRDAGIDLYRKTTVGDNVQRIAQAVQQSLERCDIVITTGGLGPTVDDPTREAVALAVGVKTEFQPELWEQIKARFQRFGRIPTENNRRQAYIPQGAIAVENPVGTAPIFILEHQAKVIITLPGVPREMEYLMTHEVIPYLRRCFTLNEIIHARVLHTVGMGESQVDDLIGDLEILANPTVGLLAHSGQVDIRITAKSESEETARELIDPVEKTIRQRLGEAIYGVDQQKLEQVALQTLTRKGWTISIVEAGLDGKLIRRLASVPGPFLGGQALKDCPSLDQLVDITGSYRLSQNADVGFGIVINPGTEKQDVYMVLVTPIQTYQFTRPYGGPPEYTHVWAINQSLDIIRRMEND